MRVLGLLVGAVVCVAALVLWPTSSDESPVQMPPTPATVPTTSAAPTPAPAPDKRPRKPLAGKVIVLDPGHQLGNARHLDQVNRMVNAGGFTKPCNSTGTETNDGFAEATFNWKVALELRAKLRADGARVHLTRTTNAYDDWGPCVSHRGRTPNRFRADVAVSIHADGGSASAHGFFVIRPASRKGWTDDIAGPSRRLARDVRAGLVGAGSTPSAAHRGGLDVRGDLGTLNWSDVPVVMVELGNMRNAREARQMRSARFRSDVYARGLHDGIVRYLR